MWRLSSYAICNFPCINVHKKPDDGSPLQPKHVAVNKLIKLAFCVVKHIYLWYETRCLATSDAPFGWGFTQWITK